MWVIVKVECETVVGELCVCVCVCVCVWMCGCGCGYPVYSGSTGQRDYGWMEGVGVCVCMCGWVVSSVVW